MEGLSAAAGVIAVGSISFQLADQFKRLYDFWSTFKDAPEDIRAIIEELKLFLDVLGHIRADEAKCGLDLTAANLLRSSEAQAKSMLDIVEALEPGFGSLSRRTRVLNALKASFKQEKVNKCRELLRETKITLILAQQRQERRTSYAQHLLRDQQYSTIIRMVTSLGLQASSQRISEVPAAASDNSSRFAPPEEITSVVENQVRAAIVRDTQQSDARRLVTSPSEMKFPVLGKKHIRRAKRRPIIDTRQSSTDYFFGSLISKHEMFDSITSSDTESQSDQNEWKSIIRIRPAAWLMKLGLQRGLEITFQASVQGWQHALETFRAVPDDSEIFRLCNNGDILGVKKLLSSGRASVWDRDPRGFTPLHEAAYGWHDELCRLLLKKGAPPTAMSDKSISPAETATRVTTRNFQSDGKRARRFIDTFGLFLQDINDSGPQDNSGWILLKGVMFSVGYWRWYPHYMRWLFPFLAPTLQSRNAESSLCSIVLESNGHNSIHVPMSPQFFFNGYAISTGELHRDPLFSQGLWHPEGRCDCRNTRLILGDAMDLHQIDSFMRNSGHQEQETPLSLAMRSSAASHLWWKALKDSGVDLRKYIARACEQPKLKEMGWTEFSLLALSKYCDSYSFYSTCPDPFCDCCGCYALQYPVELRWQRKLEEIRSHVQNGDGHAHAVHGLVEAVSKEIDGGEHDEDLWRYEVDEENEIEDGTWSWSFASTLPWKTTAKWVCWSCWANEKCRSGHCRTSKAAMAAALPSTSANSEYDGDSSNYEDSPFLPPLPFS